MLTINIGPKELFNNETQEFIETKGCTLTLEHSLVSISKWESKWHKPFMSKMQKTQDETLDYIKCMTITPNVDPNVYLNLSKENIDEIKNYIDDSMTATTFYEDPNAPHLQRETITSELIYYWMIVSNIPMECQKWHLNRLLTLIRVCSIKNSPGKKMSKREIMTRNANLNAMRRKQLNSNG